MADSEHGLRQWLWQSDPDADLYRPDDEYSDMVKQEFLEQAPLYPESPELTEEEPYTEQEPGEDIEHG